MRRTLDQTVSSLFLNAVQNFADFSFYPFALLCIVYFYFDFSYGVVSLILCPDITALVDWV